MDKCIEWTSVNSAGPRLHLVVEDEAGGEWHAGVHRLLATIQLYCTVEESVGGSPASVVWGAVQLV